MVTTRVYTKVWITMDFLVAKDFCAGADLKAAVQTALLAFSREVENGYGNAMGIT